MVWADLPDSLKPEIQLPPYSGFGLDNVRDKKLIKLCEEGASGLPNRGGAAGESAD